MTLSLPHFRPITTTLQGSVGILYALIPSALEWVGLQNMIFLAPWLFMELLYGLETIGVFIKTLREKTNPPISTSEKMIPLGLAGLKILSALGITTLCTLFLFEMIPLTPLLLLAVGLGAKSVEFILDAVVTWCSSDETRVQKILAGIKTIGSFAGITFLSLAFFIPGLTPWFILGAGAALAICGLTDFFKKKTLEEGGLTLAGILLAGAVSCAVLSFFYPFGLYLLIAAGVQGVLMIGTGLFMGRNFIREKLFSSDSKESKGTTPSKGIHVTTESSQTTVAPPPELPNLTPAQRLLALGSEPSKKRTTPKIDPNTVGGPPPDPQTSEQATAAAAAPALGSRPPALVLGDISSPTPATHVATFANRILRRESSASPSPSQNGIYTPRSRAQTLDPATEQFRTDLFTYGEAYYNRMIYFIFTLNDIAEYYVQRRREIEKQKPPLAHLEEEEPEEHREQFSETSDPAQTTDDEESSTDEDAINSDEESSPPVAQRALQAQKQPSTALVKVETHLPVSGGIPPWDTYARFYFDFMNSRSKKGTLFHHFIPTGVLKRWLVKAYRYLRREDYFHQQLEKAGATIDTPVSKRSIYAHMTTRPPLDKPTPEHMPWTPKKPSEQETWADAIHHYMTKLARSEFGTFTDLGLLENEYNRLPLISRTQKEKKRQQSSPIIPSKPEEETVPQSAMAATPSTPQDKKTAELKLLNDQSEKHLRKISYFFAEYKGEPSQSKQESEQRTSQAMQFCRFFQHRLSNADISAERALLQEKLQFPAVDEPDESSSTPRHSRSAKETLH